MVPALALLPLPAYSPPPPPPAPPAPPPPPQFPDVIGTLWGTLAADASQGNTRAALEFILALGMEAAQQVCMDGVGMCVWRRDVK